jgi:hypothetical protein
VFDRVVPPSANLIAQRQFWLGPAWAGQTVRFWASVDASNCRSPAPASRACARTSAPPTSLGSAGTAGPPPLPLEHDGAAIEVDRAVNKRGIVSLAGKQVLAAEIHGGRPVIVRIEPATLMFLDPDTRELLRTRPKPFTREQALTLQGARPAGRHPGRGPSRSLFNAASAPPA